MTRRPLNDKGVSVIVGTLLLILITVVAATSLAVMVSQLQNNYVKEQQHLAKVNAENLSIQSVVFKDNQTIWVNEWNISNSQNWSSISFTIVNMNTNDSIVEGIAINGNWAINFEDNAGNIYNNTNSSYLTVPAESYTNVNLDFAANSSSPEDPSGLTDFPTPPGFSVSTQQDIAVITSLSNTFQKTIRPPNPVYQMSIESQNLGSTTRDILVLDGSESTADNPIINWNWNIEDASNTSGDCDNPLLLMPITNKPLSGKIVRYNPQSGNAPYCVNLTVMDTTGMTATSDYFAVPADPNFVPPTQLIVDPYFSDPYNGLTVEVSDSYGHGISNQPVDLVNTPSSDLQFSQGNSQITNSLGITFFNMTGGTGTIGILSSNLPEKYWSSCNPAIAPTVTGISPTTGSITGGTSVTISGAEFTGATAVKFGSIAAASYTVNSCNQITAVSPAGSGIVDITVTTPAGTSATSSADQFTYG
jgi:flagellin-like protein